MLYSSAGQGGADGSTSAQNGDAAEKTHGNLVRVEAAGDRLPVRELKVAPGEFERRGVQPGGAGGHLSSGRGERASAELRWCSRHGGFTKSPFAEAVDDAVLGVTDLGGKGDGFVGVSDGEAGDAEAVFFQGKSLRACASGDAYSPQVSKP